VATEAVLRVAAWRRDLLAADRAATAARNRYRNGSGDGKVPPYAMAYADDEYRFWALECQRLAAVIGAYVAVRGIEHEPTREQMVPSMRRQNPHL
jgi:hypothetical protein